MLCAMTAIRETAKSKTQPRRGWRAAMLLALCLAAAICPLVSAAVMAFHYDARSQIAFINAGSLTALFVSPLVALRSGKLRDFLVGPAVGLLAGFLDLKAMLWLCTTMGWSVIAAASLPVWGATLGLWIACGRKNWPGRTAVFAAIVIADLAARLLWMKLSPSIIFGDLELADWQWLIEAFVYSPVAVLLVLLAGRR